MGRCELLPGSKQDCVQLGENNDVPIDDVPETTLALTLVATVLRPTSEFHRQVRRASDCRFRTQQILGSLDRRGSRDQQSLIVPSVL